MKGSKLLLLEEKYPFDYQSIVKIIKNFPDFLLSQTKKAVILQRQLGLD